MNNICPPLQTYLAIEFTTEWQQRTIPMCAPSNNYLHSCLWKTNMPSVSTISTRLALNHF